MEGGNNTADGEKLKFRPSRSSPVSSERFGLAPAPLTQRMRLCCFRDFVFHLPFSLFLSFFLSFFLLSPLDHPPSKNLPRNPSSVDSKFFPRFRLRRLFLTRELDLFDVATVHLGSISLEILRPATVCLSGSTRPLLFREIDIYLLRRP